MQTPRFSGVSKLFAALAIAAGALSIGWAGSAVAAAQPGQKTTVVLVHGAFAESASWNGVIARLQAKGYPVIAVANPLHGVKSDSDYVADIIEHTPGPVILVGHSYGGSVISNAVHGRSNVKALVYVAAFAPEKGETALELSGRFPGSTLGPTLAPPVPLKDGTVDLFIQQDKFAAQFAADVAPKDAALMAATQRPVAEAALKEGSGDPAWKTTPSWFIYGSADKNIPEAALKFMAERAGSKETVDIKGASHVVMVSHPDKVAAIIEDAAKATAK
ncbi:alpha/beta hydrolase [Pseudomonas gingeri]|uniref:alpha/beta fold hydrolase n=1 Tax=Pseudomonas gingeri TaxID=117681 RepID=UPI0015A29992|nr:alpha/beta hydrolase [Pseudomonas gingeri]NWD78326.1 alpha/beta hydrolase [Pseudomonas gingeri]